jgi:hypothetical protein
LVLVPHNYRPNPALISLSPHTFQTTRRASELVLQFTFHFT